MYKQKKLKILKIAFLAVIALLLSSPLMAYSPQQLGKKLYTAVEQGKYKKVKKLLRAGALVDYTDEYKNTPLMRAAYNAGIASSLYDTSQRVDIDTRVPVKKALKIIKLLLKYKARINHRCKSGETALFNAASESGLKAVKLLVKRGANINAVNKDGESVLIYILNNRPHIKVVKYLLKKGANVHLKTKSGETALDYALRSKARSITNLLKKQGAKRGKK